MPPVPKGIRWIRLNADKGVFLARPKMLPPAKKEKQPLPSLPLEFTPPMLEILNDLYQAEQSNANQN
jgi:hypothetical protein